MTTHTNWKNLSNDDLKYFISRYVLKEVQDYIIENVNKILDGNIDEFIDSYLRREN